VRSAEIVHEGDEQMIFKFIYHCLVAIAFLMFVSCISRASDVTTTSFATPDKTYSIEYLSPTEDDRDIETINVDYNSLITTFDKLNLSTYWSVTATYATGSITQLEGDINAGTLKEVQFDNSAFGIGPGLLLNFRLIEFSGMSLHLNGSGNLIIYSERFPAGGEYYNFMWRGGPVVRYNLGKSKSIGFSYQVSHVSNGQGLSSKNPSYDARGFALRYSSLF